MRVACAEVGVGLLGRDLELAPRSGRIGLLELDGSLHIVNVPRTVVTIMCLAEKFTCVWALSIFQVVICVCPPRGRRPPRESIVL